MVPFCQRPDRADRNALSAIGTFTVHHHLVKRRCDSRVEPSPDCTESTYCLNLVAYALASAAEYAFVHISDNRGSDFPLARRQLPSVERHLPDIEPEGKILEFAVAGLRAGQTFIRVV